MTPHPDSCPDRLSELATLMQGTAGIPTVIPTKCRDTARRPPCGAESRTLAALRDTLLPKLISGELRVKGKPGPEKNSPTNLANSRRPN